MRVGPPCDGIGALIRKDTGGLSPSSPGDDTERRQLSIGLELSGKPCVPRNHIGQDFDLGPWASRTLRVNVCCLSPQSGADGYRGDVISSQHCICQTSDSGISTALRQDQRHRTVCRWQHVPWRRAGSHPTFSTFSQGGSSDPGQPCVAPPPWATSPVGSGFGMSLHHASCPPFPQGRRLFSVAPRGLQEPCPTLPWVILKCPSDHVPPPSAGRVFAEPPGPQTLQ